MQSPHTERDHIEDGVWRVECLQCGTHFESKRSDATFCSTRCRVNYSREPKKLENAIEHLQSQMVEIERIAEKYKKNDRVFEAMRKLQVRINYAVSIFEQ